MSEANNLPAASHAGSITLSGDTVEASSALRNLIAGLQHRCELFDDVSVTWNSETTAEGANRSTLAFRACKHRRA
jgi:hypothetical protein